MDTRRHGDSNIGIKSNVKQGFIDIGIQGSGI